MQSSVGQVPVTSQLVQLTSSNQETNLSYKRQLRLSLFFVCMFTACFVNYPFYK